MTEEAINTQVTREHTMTVLQHMLYSHNLATEQLILDPEFNDMFEALHQAYVLVDGDYNHNEQYLRGVIDLPLHHIRERLKI